MHYDCLYIMKRLVKKYLDPDKEMDILEIGSKSFENPRKQLVFRRYFKNPRWEYTGLDIESGFNVDIVSEDLYHYPFEDKSFDLVISGNTLEHVRDVYAVVKELARVTRNLLFITVPNTRPLHRYPIDCWRIFPDGLQYLLEVVAGMKVIECKLDGGRTLADTVGVARKIN